MIGMVPLILISVIHSLIERILGSQSTDTAGCEQFPLHCIHYLALDLLAKRRVVQAAGEDLVGAGKDILPVLIQHQKTL